LRYLGASDSDVEDLAHDVFVVVHRRLEEFDPARRLRPWLFGIAFHIAARHRDRFSTRVEVPTADPPDIPSSAPPADEQIAAAEAWTIVAGALRQIELDQRAVLIMHDLEGHSAPEIAEALGLPLNTTYSRLRLARAKFSSAVRREAHRGQR
jgi:RNA polymerase sigma-70 factor (ECF subfamily)